MTWQYTRRPDGKIAVLLDNNVWDFLFDRNVDLAAELPAAEFAIFIPREVEIETTAIPVHADKAALKSYIDQTIKACGIITVSVFGFATSGGGPHRGGGFGWGTFQSQTEREFYAAIREQFLLGKSEMNSQLTKNEADAAVAAQSFFSIALTCENPTKSGPLRFAKEHGGKVLYLTEFDGTGLSLREFVSAYHQQE